MPPPSPVQVWADVRVQDRVAGAVGGGTGALYGRAFAKFGGVAAKGTLVNLALFGARERRRCHPASQTP